MVNIAFHTLVTGVPMVSFSIKRGTAILPNAGVELRHSLIGWIRIKEDYLKTMFPTVVCS